MPFVARRTELKNLNKMYDSESFEMAVIYGRRRVGKTALINQFITNKPAIYIQGIEATAELNLNYLSEAILNFESPNRLNKNKTFSNFKDAFLEIADIANTKKEKLIFVIDEFPYLAQSAPEVSSILQYMIDTVFKAHNNIMLILCGSSMSFMQHQVLGYKSPLYGRRTGQFKINPFDIFDTKLLLSKVNNEDLIAYYGLTGGVPQYLSFIDQNLSVAENIAKIFLNQNAPLQNEPNILLQEEVRKPATYFSILVAIAAGKTKSNEIAQTIGSASSTMIVPYINNLIDLGIIQRKTPIFAKNNRKSIYTFKDSMFRFWFRFIANNQDQIALNRTSGVLKYIMDQLPQFLGAVFEEVSKSWLWKQDKLPIDIKTIQNWWGNNPIKKRQEEIDIVAVNYDDSQAIVGECKWRNPDKLDYQMITTLIQRAELLPNIKKNYLYFFVKKAKPAFFEYAKQNNVNVIQYDQFFNHM